MNPQFLSIVPEVVAYNLKLYLQLTVFVIMGNRMQCSLPPNAFERSFIGDTFKQGCYNYQSNVKPLIYDGIPDHAMCRIWCGLQKGAHVAGLRVGALCSCYSREEFHFERNLRKSGCNFKCQLRKHQSCGGFKMSYLMEPIYPELPNCFDGIRETIKSATLGRAAYVDDKTNTPQKCREACSKMEYPFAAVWGMTNCWCSANFFATQLMPGWWCGLPCPGNPSVKCGGFTGAWIMKSDPVVDITCLKDQRGLTYRGRVAVSALFQEPCLQWSEIIADVKTVTSYESFGFFRKWVIGYDKMRPQDKNTTYCRNIDNDENGPWCFADSRSRVWSKAHCHIPICPSKVKKSTTSEPCTRQLFGRDYIGSKQTTYRGERCMSWSHPDVVRTLHETERGEWGFNHMPMHVQRSNLCRNTDYSPNGPWCYIDGKFPSWDYCGIEECQNVKNLGCKGDPTGLDYNGPVHNAKTGQNCRVWDSLEVQRHMSTNKRLASSFKEWSKVVQMTNLCRNPDHWEGGPWCYIETEDVPSWRSCDIKMCNEDAESLGGVAHGAQLRPNLFLLLYSLAFIIVYWKI